MVCPLLVRFLFSTSFSLGMVCPLLIFTRDGLSASCYYHLSLEMVCPLLVFISSLTRDGLSASCYHLSLEMVCPLLVSLLVFFLFSSLTRDGLSASCFGVTEYGLSGSCFRGSLGNVRCICLLLILLKKFKEGGNNIAFE